MSKIPPKPRVVKAKHNERFRFLTPTGRARCRRCARVVDVADLNVEAYHHHGALTWRLCLDLKACRRAARKAKR